MSDRDVIFISHATPDDNEFVRWLGTEADRHTATKSGPTSSISPAVRRSGSASRTRSARRPSRSFSWSRRRVAIPIAAGCGTRFPVADAVKKSLKDPEFIIPVRIDDVAFGDLPIQIHQLNAIDFTSGWGAKLADLVDTLTKADVPRVVTDLTAEFDRWRAGVDPIRRRGRARRRAAADQHPADRAASGRDLVLRIRRREQEIRGGGQERCRTRSHGTIASWSASRLPTRFRSICPPNSPSRCARSARFPTFCEGTLTDPIGPHRRDAKQCGRPDAARVVRGASGRPGTASVRSVSRDRHVLPEGSASRRPRDLHQRQGPRDLQAGRRLQQGA